MAGGEKGQAMGSEASAKAMGKPDSFPEADRREWIEKIRSAESLEEVSRLGTEGLGPIRAAWGDDLEGVRALRQFWSLCSFRAGDEDADRSAAALESAKRLAVAMMIPARLPESGAISRSRWLEEALGSASKAAAEPFARNGMGPWEASRAALGEYGASAAMQAFSVEIMSRQWGDWESLRGERAKPRKDRTAHPELASPYEARFDEVRAALREGEGRLEGRGEREVARIAARFGLGEIRIGAGTGGRFSSLAASLGDALARLAERSGFPEELVGLGGLSVGLGMDLGDAEARFRPLGGKAGCIEMGDPPGSLGHEWTHALEFWARRADPKASGARIAFDALEDVWRSAPQDPAAAEHLRREMGEELEAQTARMASRYAGAIARDGKPDRARELGIEPGDRSWDVSEGGVGGPFGKPAPAKLREEIGRMLEGADLGGFAALKAKARIRLWAREAMGKGYGAEVRDLMVKDAERLMRMARGRREILARLDEGSSAMWAGAEWAGHLVGGNFRSYLLSGLERAARVGEGFFHDPEAPMLAWAHGRDPVRPQGLERERANEAFSRVLEASRERLLEAKAEREAKVEACGEEALLEARVLKGALGLLGRLSGFRGDRKAEAEIGPGAAAKGGFGMGERK